MGCLFEFSCCSSHGKVLGSSLARFWDRLQTMSYQRYSSHLTWAYKLFGPSPTSHDWGCYSYWMEWKDSPEVTDQVLMNRAKALLMIGAIFKAIEPDETDEERRELERCALMLALCLICDFHSFYAAFLSGIRWCGIDWWLKLRQRRRIGKPRSDPFFSEPWIDCEREELEWQLEAWNPSAQTIQTDLVYHFTFDLESTTFHSFFFYFFFGIGSPGPHDQVFLLLTSNRRVDMLLPNHSSFVCSSGLCVACTVNNFTYQSYLYLKMLLLMSSMCIFLSSLRFDYLTFIRFFLTQGLRLWKVDKAQLRWWNFECIYPGLGWFDCPLDFSSSSSTLQDRRGGGKWSEKRVFSVPDRQGLMMILSETQ